MEIEDKYRGFIISYPKIPRMGNAFQVNIGSDNPHLMAKLAPSERVGTGSSMADALAKGKAANRPKT